MTHSCVELQFHATKVSMLPDATAQHPSMRRWKTQLFLEEHMACEKTIWLQTKYSLFVREKIKRVSSNAWPSLCLFFFSALSFNLFFLLESIFWCMCEQTLLKKEEHFETSLKCVEKFMPKFGKIHHFFHSKKKSWKLRFFFTAQTAAKDDSKFVI